MGIAIAALTGSQKATAQAPTLSVDPSRLPRLGTVDERFQSYNLEMVEVTGGRFWKPYRASASAPSARGADNAGNVPAGSNPDLYAYREPIDLSNSRLRILAAALAPAYMRVSGTWANTTYFAENDETPATPPNGFRAVLSRERWKAVIDLARAVNAEIVTSMATGPGVRDAAGRWQSDQARRFFAYTRSIGGRIAAAEFMNEPTLAAMGGAPDGYDAAAYGRDFKAFVAFIRTSEPDVMVLGPGSIGETAAPQSSRPSFLSTRDLLAASGSGIDVFSYHHYGAVSQRCAPGQTTSEAALSEAWLASTDQTRAYYQSLRDEFAPDKPMWLTETAETACGGNPWASTFLDTFRYLDQLGRLARAGVKMVAHNTLAASDYGLLDEKTLQPRPNYWAALLWRRLMGTTVLDAGVHDGMRLYAHCRRGVRGAVALLAINTDRTNAATLRLPVTSERYTLSADHLQSAGAKLNGTALDLGPNDDLPRLAAVTSPPGSIEIGPATITFLTVGDAKNPACD
ncbi:hypothetical protein [Bradyrhizobium sp. AZCC 1610]|uniref:hypothetical protein n=1 Tax=Bradyrhizobium sp. AZCC 1610 TaxID=3117020 RepID=UPI002FF0C51A